MWAHIGSWILYLCYRPNICNRVSQLLNRQLPCKKNHFVGFWLFQCDQWSKQWPSSLELWNILLQLLVVLLYWKHLDRHWLYLPLAHIGCIFEIGRDCYCKRQYQQETTKRHKRVDHGHGNERIALTEGDRMVDVVVVDFLLQTGLLEHLTPSSCPWLLGEHFAPPKQCVCHKQMNNNRSKGTDLLRNIHNMEEQLLIQISFWYSIHSFLSVFFQFLGENKWAFGIVSPKTKYGLNSSIGFLTSQ